MFDMFMDMISYFEKNYPDTIPSITSPDAPDLSHTVSDVFYSVPVVSGITAYNMDIARKNEELYRSYLNAYNAYIEEYAEKVRAMELDDLQLIVKILYDQWNDIDDGIGTAKYDIFGMWRYDICTRFSVAKCKNTSDDFTARINAVDPSYEAINVACCLDDEAYNINTRTYANIDRPKCDYASPILAIDKYEGLYCMFDPGLCDEDGSEISYRMSLIPRSYKPEENRNIIMIRGAKDGVFSDYWGDHMISMISIRDKDNGQLKYHLLVDSSNVNILALKNGKVYDLSNVGFKDIELRAPGQMAISSFDDSIQMALAVRDSVDRADEIDIYELKQMYDVYAINRALEYVKRLS